MQIPKQIIKDKILASAKKELFTKGFKNSSMRNIAKNSGVSLSNIYNYFTDKDSILEEVLKPLMETFYFILKEHNKDENININIVTSDSYKQEMVKMYLDLLNKHRKELKLLLFHSYGSKYENFREQFTDKQMKTGKAFLKSLKIKYSQLEISGISDYFLHVASTWQLSILGEIVFHNISGREMEQILDNSLTFSTAGWNELLKI